MDRESFEADLSRKDWVIEIVEQTSNELKGFSTQVVKQFEVDGRSIRTLFSGDTIVDRDQRGQQRLFQVSGWLLRRLMEAYPDDELYWFLISKGYKTYRFLPLFFREFYPTHKVTTPPQFSAVIEALAAHFGGDARFDRQAGVLRAGPTACQLRSGVADITKERLRDQHVRFFANANPGHVKGDELCCIAPLTHSNLTRAAYRAMGSEPLVDSVCL
jgi:hypothetical protein